MRIVVMLLAALCFLYGTAAALLSSSPMAGVLPLLYAIFFAILMVDTPKK